MKVFLIILFGMLGLIFNAFAFEIKLAQVRCEDEKAQMPQEEKKSINPSLITATQIQEKRDTIQNLAIQRGISLQVALLSQGLVFNPSVAIKEVTQPEKTLTFNEYLTKTMPSYKVLDAKKFLIDNWNELDLIEKEYKVDKEIIVALILVETYFGKILGNFNIMDSLFTLSLTSYRSDFWQTELLNVFFLIERGDNLYTRETKGSWAGAVGMVQFIPSSFIKLAKNGDGSGRIDTINNKLDAFASAANYLKVSGWQYKKPYLRNASIGIEKSQFCKVLGKKMEDGVLVMPDKKPETPAFIVYNNYDVVLKWNRSLFFATTVGIIFNELKDVSQTHP
jgi:membrane-bound lytic murein transglycosylase B